MARKTARESILQEKTVKSPKVKVRSDKRFQALKNASVLSVILVIAICIVFNLIIDLTLDKKLTFDTTSVKQNSITSLSESYLKDLDKKVEIIGLFDKNDTSIEWRDYFLPILDDYEAKADGMIDLKYIDPDVDPFILTQIDPNNVYNLQKYTYVVKCGDLLVSVNPYSCFEYDSEMMYYYGVYKPVGNQIENTFTGYIRYVTSGRPLHAYYLAGHNLPSHSNLDNILLSLGMVSSELSINNESAKIPDDCELLVILEPKSDLTITEKEIIKSYIDNSGKILLVSDFDKENTLDFTNLNDVTLRMGVTLEQGIVHENDITRLYTASDPYTSIASVDDKYAQAIGLQLDLYNANCRYLKITPDMPDNVYVSPLVITSGSASVDFQNAQIDAAVSAGTYPVILMSVDATRSDAPSCMIIVGTSAFTSDTYYSTRTLSDNNAVFVRRMIGDICEISIERTIPTKTIPSYALSKPLSSSAATMWSVIVMTIIPLGCLICGIYTYRRRRHL